MWSVLRDLSPILILLLVVVVVIARLPRVELGHSKAFLRRRLLNWLPLGLTYAFLYMGRYNLNAAKNALGDRMSTQDFSEIFFWGTLTYGFAFVINGPLTDKLGGRKTILISAIGSALCNLAMGWVLYSGGTGSLVATFSVLYSVNMYFQSFGAVSIVKVNAHWFHVRERGTFGGIFGILISLGIYFAYDWGRRIVENFDTATVFFVPTVILLAFAVLDWFLVFDRPGQTGHADFDTGGASEDGPRLGVIAVAKKMFSNPVIVTIAVIEFCSGYLRQAIMQYYPFFAKATGSWDAFVGKNWGMLLCVAGITGGVFAGTISDHMFGSRRGPVSAVLYALMLVGAVIAWLTIDTAAIGWVVVVMSLAIIGVHGMLSGTASADFGGKQNAGVAVGLIDGFVYLGTATVALVMGSVLPKDGTPEYAQVSSWSYWPIAMIPLALIGLLLALRLWNAKPRSSSAGH